MHACMHVCVCGGNSDKYRTICKKQHIRTYVSTWYIILSKSVCTYMCLDSRVLAPFHIVGIVEMVGYILTTEAALLTRDPIETENTKLYCHGNI